MELCPELVAKPMKDKPLVCNFQQQVCVLIRTDSWVRRLELACHAVAVPTTGANGRKMSHSQRRIRLAATLARVRVKQAAGGKTQRSGAHSREGAAVMGARAHGTSLPPATRPTPYKMDVKPNAFSEPRSKEFCGVWRLS